MHVEEETLVRLELAQSQRHRRSCDVAVGRVVHPIHQVARLLEFDRKEKRRRSVHGLGRATVRIRAAGFNVVHPKVKAGFVGFAIEKVQILLPHKVRRRIQRIAAATCQGRRERGFGVIAELTKRGLRRTEVVVRARRRHRVYPARLDVVEVIGSFGAGDG